MGMFQVAVKVANAKDPDRSFQEDFWVDAAAEKLKPILGIIGGFLGSKRGTWLGRTSVKTRRLLISSLVLGVLLGGTAGSAGPKAAATKPSKAAAATKPSKAAARRRADVRKLLVLTGSAKLGQQVLDHMIVQLKKAVPRVPAEFWTEFRKDANVNEMLELIVPIYEKHFTHEDIKALISFYESPVGKKFVAKLPTITREAMAAGQKWGAELANRAIERIRNRKNGPVESGQEF